MNFSMINDLIINTISPIILSFSIIIFIIFFTIIADNIGLIDKPTKRKIHLGNIPLIGGLSIYSSLLFFFLIIETNFHHKIIFLTSLIVFFVGLYDDKFDLGIITRFFFQIIACLIIVGFGIRIFDLGDYLGTTIFLGGFGILLSFITMIGYINAINFSDGLDGLASGYVLNCLISIIFFSIMNNSFQNLQPLFFLIFILIIFLFSNFGLFLPKSFLGDSGSTSLGFLISSYLIYFTMPENRHFHPVLALWAAPFPTFDFITVFIKRILLKINPFQPDRRHLHYLLINSLISNNLISLILVSGSIICSILGFMTFYFLGSTHSIIFFFFCLFIYFLISVYINDTIKKK